MSEPRSKTRLVIVESPTKARTISRFLPQGYQVEASMGHVRDLPSSAAEIPEAVRKEKWSRLGVNVDDGFEPIYIVAPGKRDVVKRLRSALKGADEVYIATDEDREGESIGWHLVEVLSPKVPVRRMVFHEITEQAIREALENTRQIDRDLVDAQETRRVLDRLVGYEISPLLWRKIAPRLSAGRVQSVAVRLLVLRERERLDFIAGSYWDLKAALASDGSAFNAELTHVAQSRVAQGRDFDPDTGRLKDSVKDVILVDEPVAALDRQRHAGDPTGLRPAQVPHRGGDVVDHAGAADRHLVEVVGHHLGDAQQVADDPQRERHGQFRHHIDRLTGR